ncbi:zinc finger, CCHC-type containing protein, partial [Tanacetum coccineum]
MDWYRNLRIVLSVEDKLPYLEQPIPTMTVLPTGQVIPPDVLNTHTAWVKASKEIVGLMLMTIDPEIQKTLEHLGAFDMLKELKTLYVQQADQELLQTVREFHTCKQEEGQSVSSYVLKMKSYIDNLERLGHAMTQNLSKKSHKAAKGNQGKGKAKMGYAPVQAPPFAPKPKNPPTPKKDNPAKDVICHQCGEVGHWRRNCPIYLAELMKKKKLSQGASTSGIFTIELYYFPSTSWVYDTGCGTHICITTQGLRGSRKLKPGALSMNNLIYFNVIPQDDIYEIDLSSSNTNDSSMYVVSNKRAKLNLDSALLWHYHLGHISKKCIEKLQHDGLLDSTDIKSFEKCVSCMSGKMARKPYSHQVERAKDLLGLIHTDALVKRDTLTKHDKLELRSIKCIFVGYPKETMGYSFYYPSENKVFVAWKAEFSENSLIAQEASRSLKDLEIIQEEGTNPSIDSSLHNEEDDQEIDEPQ